MIDHVLAVPEILQSRLFEGVVLPLAYRLGLMRFAEDAYAATGIFVLGALQVAGLWMVLRPLEAWRPVERWTDRRAVRVDVLYTLLERLGILPLAFFFMLRPVVDGVDGGLRKLGWIPPNLEDVIPGLMASPLAAFLVYLVVLDFLEYARHRLQHRFDWWWALHAVHHSQRQLSFWADDRNHLLDSLIAEAWRAAAALAIGVPTGQFVLIVVLTRVVESLSHANVRFGFGRLGDRFLVSPRYHRIHHGVGVGHEGPSRGCNFAALFPAWDMLFGTGNFRRVAPATGIADQLAGVDYGQGLIAQQVKGLGRMARALGLAR